MRALLTWLLWAGAAAAQMVPYEVTDRQGFDREMVAYTLDVPRDWMVEGQVLWQKPCSGNDLYELVLTARSADGRTGIRVVPGHQILWNEAILAGLDPYLEAQMKAQVEADRNRLRTQWQGSNCHVGLVRDAEALVNSFVLSQRPGAQVLKRTPNEAMRQQYAQLGSGAQVPGMSVAYDAFTLELTYPLGAGPVIERVGFSWYMFQSEIRDATMYALNQHTVVNALQLEWFATERQDADEALLKQIGASFRVNPEWQRKVGEVQQKLAEQRRQTNEQNAQARERDRIQRELRNDQQHQQFLNYIQQ
ncbi:MAG: hypothetical protein KDK24_01345 [Pseudooceanicola sp.]|nr:hypothetical protein [Pseudooceanicola sp.]